MLRSGEDGFVLSSEWNQTLISGNTSAMNRGSGFVLDFNDSGFGSAIQIRNNIAFGNGGWGMTWSRPELPTIGCNDWFGNRLGAVSGALAGATDFMVDPQFCDIDADDVSLLESSPLIDGQGCGQIGARGQGCATTPALAALLRARAEPDGIRIEWQ